MTPGSLFSIPLPFVTALLACVIAMRLSTGVGGNRTSRGFFAALFVLFALEAVLVGLRFGYGIDVFAPIQRLLPLAVGPFMLLGFRALAEPRGVLARQTVAHIGVAMVVMAACFVYQPLAAWLDALIAISYCVYLVLLVRLWRRGPDIFTNAPLSNVAALRRWLFWAIVFLAFILFLDSLIAIEFALDAGRRVSSLIALGSLPLILIFIATALFAPFGAPAKARRNSAGAADRNPAPDDGALAQRATSLLEETRLYRDPDLTLSRLARRLGVPARHLSIAINIVHGVNVSQFVNDYRIRDAAERLTLSSDSVAEIMTASGFLTRSNFYREFRRAHGVSPAEYRRNAAPDETLA